MMKIGQADVQNPQVVQAQRLLLLRHG